jgi:hypothetical protein
MNVALNCWWLRDEKRVVHKSLWYFCHSVTLQGEEVPNETEIDFIVWEADKANGIESTVGWFQTN